MAVEQLRVVLIIALCVVSFLLWDAWQRDYGPKPSPPTGTEPPSPDAGPTGDAISPSVDVRRPAAGSDHGEDGSLAEGRRRRYRW